MNLQITDQPSSNKELKRILNDVAKFLEKINAPLNDPLLRVVYSDKEQTAKVSWTNHDEKLIDVKSLELNDSIEDFEAKIEEFAEKTERKILKSVANFLETLDKEDFEDDKHKSRTVFCIRYGKKHKKNKE